MTTRNCLLHILILQQNVIYIVYGFIIIPSRFYKTTIGRTTRSSSSSSSLNSYYSPIYSPIEEEEEEIENSLDYEDYYNNDYLGYYYDNYVQQRPYYYDNIMYYGNNYYAPYYYDYSGYYYDYGRYNNYVQRRPYQRRRRTDYTYPRPDDPLRNPYNPYATVGSSSIHQPYYYGGYGGGSRVVGSGYVRNLERRIHNIESMREIDYMRYMNNPFNRRFNDVERYGRVSVLISIIFFDCFAQVIYYIL